MTSKSPLLVFGMCANCNMERGALGNWLLAHYLQDERSQAGTKEQEGVAHKQKLPVWPVVSIPAKKRAAISGSSCLSERSCLVRGSLVFISRSAKVPGSSFVDFMCSRRSLMIFYRGRMQHQSQLQVLPTQCSTQTIIKVLDMSICTQTLAKSKQRQLPYAAEMQDCFLRSRISSDRGPSMASRQQAWGMLPLNNPGWPCCRLRIWAPHLPPAHACPGDSGNANGLPM